MADSIYSIVELVGTSATSWEHAVANAVERASLSLRDLRIAGVARMDLQIGADGAVRYRALVEVSFKYDEAGLPGTPPAAAVRVVRARAATAGDGTEGRAAGWLIGAARKSVGPIYHLLWKVRVEGAENVPSDRGAIIAANHVSFFDSVVLIMSVPRRLSFVGKSEYMDSWKTKHLLPALGMIPVDRGKGHQAMGALQVAAEVLADNGLFGIYPEGTRSRDGKLGPGHTGVAHLAVATGAPIVPVGIVGTQKIQPPGARVPRPFVPAIVRFGVPIDPENYAGGRRTRRREITDDVMSAIADLSGQDFASTPS